MRATFTVPESLTVQCRGGVPVLFRRPARTRGSAVLRDPRWYRVRAVVASWSEAVPWWRAVTPAGRGHIGAGCSGDRRVWRVEARPAREPLMGKSGKHSGGIDVFDLVEQPDGRWLLLRAHD